LATAQPLLTQIPSPFARFEIVRYRNLAELLRISLLADWVPEWGVNAST
jgi:hypothetical protein